MCLSTEWGQVQEESGTGYSEEGQLSEQATLSDFTTINAKHTSFNLDPNYYGVLGVNDFPLLHTEGLRHSRGGGTRESSDEPKLSGELGCLKSISHERVTSSLWRPPLYYPLLASAPVTQFISSSSVQLLPQCSLGPRPSSLRTGSVSSAMPSEEAPRGPWFALHLVPSTVPGKQRVGAHHYFFFV